MLGAAGYALTLQVAHPTIAAGVRDFSNYATDPWGRAFRTADYVFLLCYGRPGTVDQVAANLRDAHRRIRGVDHHGSHYSALEPSAYAWVHATLGISIMRGHQLMGTPLTPLQRDEFWDQWLMLGDVLQVRRSDLPTSAGELDPYLQRMTDDVLEDNDVIQTLYVAAGNAVGGSPWHWLPAPVFAVAGRPLGRLARFLGSGMLGDDLRSRFRYPWSPRHQAAFDAYCAASRATTPLLPRPMREMGPLVLRMRRREIGPFGQKNSSVLRAS
jgi:uncharacterized protein (DUF2236 family)